MGKGFAPKACSHVESLSEARSEWGPRGLKLVEPESMLSLQTSMLPLWSSSATPLHQPPSPPSCPSPRLAVPSAQEGKEASCQPWPG